MRTMVAAICILMTSVFTANGEEEQQPQTLHEWYLKYYDFVTMEDTIYTLESEFEIPDGYHRPDSSDLTPFQNWVSHFPLWHQWKPVGIWKGGKAYEYDEVSRVVHLPWTGPHFKDRAIPLRILAEFLRHQYREFELQLVPRMGDTLRYEDWLKGKPRYSGRGEVFFKPAEPRTHDLYEFFGFVDLCMRNTSFGSLADNCDSVAPKEAAPGDLFIAHDERGLKGVVYVILYMLVNDAGDRLYAVATGCDVACDFHIPMLNSNRDYPWVTSEGIKALAGEMPRSGFYRFRIK